MTGTVKLYESLAPPPGGESQLIPVDVHVFGHVANVCKRYNVGDPARNNPGHNMRAPRVSYAETLSTYTLTYCCVFWTLRRWTSVSEPPPSRSGGLCQGRGGGPVSAVCR